jgi:hypothetical protein
MANLKPVLPGAPLSGLSASDWNACLEAAKAHRLGGDLEAGQVRQRVKPNVEMLVRNDSGSDIDRLAVLGISQPVITPSSNIHEFEFNFAFSGVTPEETHRGNLAVTSEPIAAGKIGRAYIDGIVVCRVEVSHEIIMRADVGPGDSTKLDASLIGAWQILWKESGTGTKWAIVRIAPPSDVNLVGKTNAAITAGASGSVSIWLNDEDSGIDMTASLKWFHGGQDISSGVEVGLKYYAADRELRIVHADCED